MPHQMPHDIRRKLRSPGVRFAALSRYRVSKRTARVSSGRSSSSNLPLRERSPCKVSRALPRIELTSVGQHANVAGRTCVYTACRRLSRCCVHKCVDAAAAGDVPVPEKAVYGFELAHEDVHNSFFLTNVCTEVPACVCDAGCAIVVLHRICRQQQQ